MNQNDERAAALKPCPFCGGPVSLEECDSTRDYMHGERRWWGITCRNTMNRGGTCAVEIRPQASQEAAIERWNRRAALEQPGDGRPDMSGMIDLMRQAQHVAPSLTTIEPIALTPVQVAWIIGKIKHAPQASADDARDAAVLAEVRRAMDTYNADLKARQHGGVAAGQALHAIAKALTPDWNVPKAGIAALQRKEG